MPIQPLPSNPNLEHLKHQAKDLQKARSSFDLAALQRIREFHPRFRKTSDQEIASAKFSLSDAYLTIAREHGFSSWPKLRQHVESGRQKLMELPLVERIEDPIFRQAVSLIDKGDEDGLRKILARHPSLVTQRITFDGGGYFENPTLLNFVAENPVRNDRLPPNIVQIARIILEAGSKDDPHNVGYTASLVASGRVPREHGVQIPLLELFVEYGLEPGKTVGAALVHGELEAVHALVRLGAPMTLSLAATLGYLEDARRTLPDASPEERHGSLVLAAMYGNIEIARLLLDSGEDPNRYNPMGLHSHSTVLHQAVWAGQVEIVRLLLERGARTDLADTLFHSTALGWAEYGGQTEIAEILRTT